MAANLEPNPHAVPGRVGGPARVHDFYRERARRSPPEAPGRNVPARFHEWLRGASRIHDLGVFFVVGCQKSGTTWVQNLLDGHPHLCCRGEGHFLDEILTGLKDLIGRYGSRHPQGLRLDNEDMLWTLKVLVDRLLLRYLESAPDPAVIHAVGDKTPEHTIALEVLNAVYPDARFIHVIRDGRDGAVSGWAQIQKEGGLDVFPTFADYAEYFARHHWLFYILRARQVSRAFPARYLEVRYEDLHGDPTGETRRILGFLGVDDSLELARKCVDSGSFERHSGGRARGTEDPASHYRKGVVGDWRGRFDPEALRRFDGLAGFLLADLGYSRT